MKKILNLAWRNIWRNKRRTLITAASVFFAVLFSSSMWNCLHYPIVIDLLIVFSDEGLGTDLESCDVSGQVSDVDVVVGEDTHHTGIAPFHLVGSVAARHSHHLLIGRSS